MRTFWRRKKAPSIPKFCGAALHGGQEVIIDILRHFPDNTAANYVSKIRALRDFIGRRNLSFCTPEQVAKILTEIGVTRVNDISKRKLKGDCAESRSVAENYDEIVVQLRHLTFDDLLRIRVVVDDLLASKVRG